MNAPTLRLINIVGWFFGDEAQSGATPLAPRKAPELLGFVLICGFGVDADLIEQVRSVIYPFFDLKHQLPTQQQQDGLIGTPMNLFHI